MKSNIQQFIGRMQGPVLGFQIFQALRYGFLLVAALSIPVLSSLPGQPDKYEWLNLLGVSMTFLWASSIFDAYVVGARGKSELASLEIDQSAFWITQVLSGLSILPFFFILDDAAFWYGVFLFFEMGSHWTVIRLLNQGKGLLMLVYGLLAYGGYAVIVAAMTALGYTLDEVFAVAALFAGLRWMVVALAFKPYLGFGSKTAYWALLKMALPLAAAAFFSQSALLIDSYLVHARFPDAFPQYRYGSKEFPLILLLANALSVAQSGNIAAALPQGKLGEALAGLRKSGTRLMHIGFGSSILLLAGSNFIFNAVLGPDYAGAIPVFDVCLLLSIPRLIFPQAIVRGHQQGIVLGMSAGAELLLKVALSFLFIHFLGIPGLVLATVIGFVFEKLILVAHCHFRLRLPVTLYSNLGVWSSWSLALVGLLVLKYFVWG